MSDLVKTGKKLLKELTGGRAIVHRLYLLDKKYLVLPDGLDRLEEMLKEEIEKEIKKCKDLEQDYIEAFTVAIGKISSVFARFKKEEGLK